MSLADYVREKMQSFLQIQPPQAFTINLDGMLDYKGNAIKNRIWYRGDATELSQLYKQIDLYEDRHLFWASIPTAGLEIAKRHTGLPAIIVDTLTSIVVNNLNDITLKEPEQNRVWLETVTENKFEKMLTKAVSTALFIGDGAFKISFDPEISDYPIIEFVAGDSIEYRYTRGRLTEIIFKTPISHGTSEFTLEEHYGYGYIKYELFNGEEPIGILDYEETERYQDVTFGDESDKYMLAIPLMFYQSEKYYGRGRSVFDKKIDAFDGLDEAWSQWLDALRAGRSKTYIPESLLPRDPHTGQVRPPNAFDNRYIQTDADLKENGQNRITTESAPIQYDGYLATYVTALDLCLQGLISPSTIGIDVKKLDNAEAQREKEKVTLYTRGVIIEALQEDLQALAENTIKAYYEWTDRQIVEPEAEVTFGDYANPSFESQIATVAMARQGGVMSIQTVVEELYGDTRDDAWKEDEVRRLKVEYGIAEQEEPRVNMDMYL